MRTIKFKGYNKKNGEWLYGYYLVNRHQHFIAPDGVQPPERVWQDFEVDPASIGQFTGLFDREGNEIYEGDIVRLEHLLHEPAPFEYVVRFDEGSAAILPRGLVNPMCKVSIVGNSYQDVITLNTKK